ncbi:MAG: type I methionyl aminopeptidase [Omnitrophica bacterium RIFCSPLOWO2_12_FULL_50_11]|nr:MAG: type I methionyl aminopeptidase [Omnitrophica bacterium RIFCSPLOWO2_12_FULL_50_11]
MISLKSKHEILLMRESAKRLKAILKRLEKSVCPGITTYEIDQKAEQLMAEYQAKPAFKGYRGFPASVCTSPNRVVVHGIPSKKCRLEEGDIVSVDIGIIHEGYYSDAARTWPVGRISGEAIELIEVARQALYAGMQELKPRNRIGDLSYAIQNYVESKGFSVVRDFVGHGIGRALHEDPQVPNFGRPGKGPRLEVGMVLAIEPMVVAGSHEVEILQDSWTVVTRDHRLASHYEDTVALTEEGPINLTGPQTCDGSSE